MKRIRPWFAIILGVSHGHAAQGEAAGPIQPPLFEENCADCHGDDARGAERGPTLINPEHFIPKSVGEIAGIIEKGKGKMPAFDDFAPADILAMANYIRALNATVPAAPGAGDAKAGEQFFFGAGKCSSCHVAGGRGSSLGPNLSGVGKKLRGAELVQSLVEPSAIITDGYDMYSVELNNGSTLRGFARALGSHDIVLQTDDGRLHVLVDSEYRKLTPDKRSAMPAFQGTASERRDLLAFLSQQNGIGVGAVKEPQVPVTQAEMDAIMRPKPGEWPSYNGNLNGNRHSSLDQINRRTVSRLQLQWTFSVPFAGLEATPLVVDGVMYVTGNNQVYALSGKTGREIWRYERPKSPRSIVSGDAAIGVNRGVAVVGNRVFYLTDDARLLALDRLTGALLWEVYTPEERQAYGGTSAPLVMGDLVIAGVSGGDNGIRGFVSAYKVTTGELAWRLWTIPKVGETGPAAETWKGTALALGGGATWLSGSADVDANVLYWTVGNPHPDTDGDEREGANLYTNSDLAIDAKTGKILWYYQFTPHDLHDWDVNQPIVLVNTKWRGQDRKLLLHANRNGFLYVLDRAAGKPLLASRMVDKLTWASGINPVTWTPDLLPNNEVTKEGVKTAPAVRGATNWYSTAFNPNTGLYYVMTVEDYSIYRKAANGGFGKYINPDDPAQKILRAFEIENGKEIWKIVMPGVAENNYSGVLSTEGGVLFFGECTGGFAAADARTGKYLWHVETHARPFKGSPMTYMIDGRQYVAIAAGSNFLSFALPASP